MNLLPTVYPSTPYIPTLNLRRFLGVTKGHIQNHIQPALGTPGAP